MTVNAHKVPAGSRTGCWPPCGGAEGAHLSLSAWLHRELCAFQGADPVTPSGPPGVWTTAGPPPRPVRVSLRDSVDLAGLWSRDTQFRTSGPWCVGSCPLQPRLCSGTGAGGPSAVPDTGGSFSWHRGVLGALFHDYAKHEELVTV